MFNKTIFLINIFTGLNNVNFCEDYRELLFRDLMIRLWFVLDIDYLKWLLWRSEGVEHTVLGLSDDNVELVFKGFLDSILLGLLIDSLFFKLKGFVEVTGNLF